MADKKYVPLSELPRNVSARIYEFSQGMNLRRRLLDMGLNLGREIEKLNEAGGALVLKVGEARLALGRGVAEKIIVEYDVE